jgi:hypothetical protein
VLRQSDRPFIWYPFSGQRHAVKRQDRTIWLGELMHCLCGATHPPPRQRHGMALANLPTMLGSRLHHRRPPLSVCALFRSIPCGLV